MHPAVYHGQHKSPPYFEGWYYKLVSADQSSRFAVIPGVILGEKGHAFVQVLDGTLASTQYHEFPLSDFRASEKEFEIRIGNNTFNIDGFSLDLDTPAGRTLGNVHVHSAQPWPVTLASPGIMGWYAWMPAMQCYHGVLGFDHALSGSLDVDGRTHDFTAGRGYIEKDWGAAFPEGYVWMQTNHFERPGVCLTASVAIIPWLGSAFPGFIVGLWMDGNLYRFATYTGARLEKLAITDERVEWILVNRSQRLEIVARRAEAGLLKGPTTLDMGKRVDETLKASVWLRLTTITGDLIFEGTGLHAGLEVFQPERLLEMVGVKRK